MATTQISKIQVGNGTIYDIKDTTYSAGSGLSLSGTTINHSNSITAGTASGSASKTLTFGDTFTIPTITYDAQGHITGKGTTTMTMPTDPNVDTKVTQTATTTNADYRILLSGGANDSNETTTSFKNTNLKYNPGSQLLSIGGSITATGNLNITGIANLNSEVYANSLTAGSLLVNGGASFVNGASFSEIPTAPTPATNSNDTSVATTAFVKNNLGGLSGAMHFKGTTTTALSDGTTTAAVTIGGSSYTPSAGDVVLYSDSEFVWTGSAWERLGRDSSFKVTQTAVSAATTASTAAATTFVSVIEQDTNGVIKYTTKVLPVGSTSVTGIVMLSSATNSTATNVAATPSAVKVAYDLAASKSATTGTVTQVIAGTGLSIGTTAGGNFTTSGTINHTNSVTAQTTQALYPIKIDAQGHISGYGTAITSLPASDVSAWAKASTKPSYTASEVGLGNVANLDQSKAIKSITRSGTTFTYTALDGTTGTFTQQDSDSKVTQTVKSDNGEYPILTKDSTSVTSVTATSNFVDGIIIQPSSKTISTSGFIKSSKGIYSYNTGSENVSGFFKFATLKVSASYTNCGIQISYTSRSRTGGIIYLIFNNVNSNDPELTITKTGEANIYYIKSSTSTWDLYINKSENYDDVVFSILNSGQLKRGSVDLTWSNTSVTALPTGYLTAAVHTLILNITGNVSGSAGSVAWTGVTGKPTTISGYGITDAKIANGVITLGSNTITPITAHQAVSNKNATLAWSTTSTIATIGGTDIKVTMPANPNTDKYHKTGSWSGITYTASAVNSADELKFTLPSATTSATGVVQLSSATNSTATNVAATPSAVKAAYDLANTANTAANNYKYWANIESTSAATYNKTPEMAIIKLNGNTGASAASTSNVSLVYNSTTQALDFVFA